MKSEIRDSIKVSVIITSYGVPNRLKRSIESVLNQTLKNIELIIVDDNGKNTENQKRTESIIKSLSGGIDLPLQYIKHDTNLNGSNARNTGVIHARGEFISFLDNDDEYLPSRLEKCYSALQNESHKYQSVFTGFEIRQKNRAPFIYKKVESGNFLIETLACSFKYGTGSNLFIKKNVYNELGGFDGNFWRHQDYEFLIRYFGQYSLLGLKEVLVIKNNDNINLPTVEKMALIKTQLLTKYSALIQTLEERDKKFIYYQKFIQLAEHSIKEGNSLKQIFTFYWSALEYKILSYRELIKGAYLLIMRVKL